jgi:multiple sugar transport system substrate-binding protein
MPGLKKEDTRKSSNYDPSTSTNQPDFLHKEENMLRKRLYPVFALIMVGLLLFTACTPKSGGNAPVKLTIFVGFGAGSDPDSMAALNTIAEEYNASHTDIQIEFMFSTWEEHTSKFSTLLAGDLAPDLAFPIGIQGIAEFYDEWIDVSTYVQRDNYDTTDFYGPSLQLLNFNEKTIGLPLGVYPSVTFFNEDLFDSANVPYPPKQYGDTSWTLEKMIETAKLMTLDENGNNAASSNFDATKITQWGWGGWCGPFRTVPGKFGGNPLGMSDDFKSANMNTDGYLEGMQFLYDSIYSSHVRPSSIDEGSTFTGMDFTFESGKVAMFECFSWSSYAFPNFTTAGNWNVAAVPAGPQGDVVSPVNADTFAIPAHSKHPDQAWEVAKWLMQPEMQSRLCGIFGCIPSRKSLASGWVDSMSAEYPNADFQVFIDSINYMDASPNNESWVPNYSKVWDATENAMSRILSGESNDVQQVMNDLQSEVQGFLDEYWAAHP